MDEMVISDGVLPNASSSMFFLTIFRFPSSGGFTPLYSPPFSIPPSTCLLSNFILEFLSLFPQLFDFQGVKVVENTVHRSSPH